MTDDATRPVAPPRRTASERRLRDRRLITVAALLAATFGGLAILYFVIAKNPPGPAVDLGSVIVLLAGVVTLTLVLYLGTTILRALDLASPAEALGMPQGSIRALIAIMLILMFVIVGLVVFTTANREPAESHGITQGQIDRLRQDGAAIVSINRSSAQPDPSGEPVYDVTSVSGMPAEAHDFGLQLLSTVIALVVAVAGFYFGAQTVSQAGKDTRDQLGQIQTARARIREEIIGAVPEKPSGPPPDDPGDEPDVVDTDTVDATPGGDDASTGAAGGAGAADGATGGPTTTDPGKPTDEVSGGI